MSSRPQPRVINYFTLFFSIFFLFCTKVFSVPDCPEYQKREILEEDRCVLDALFRHLIVHEGFGYVLFGEKPMAWTHIQARNFYIRAGERFEFKLNHLLPCLRTWQKYFNHFESDNFVIRIYKYCNSQLNYGVLIINKPKLLHIIQQNIHLFRQKLGEKTDPNEILKDLQTKDDLLGDVFHDHHDLLGIVLGFGIHNSTEFQNSCSLIRNRAFPPPYDAQLILTFNAIVEEMNAILFKMVSSQQHSPFTFIALPAYIEDPNHHESKQIKTRYLHEQKRIAKIYSRGDFLNISLNRLNK